jgi:hypothetical protein
MTEHPVLPTAPVSGTVEPHAAERDAANPRAGADGDVELRIRRDEAEALLLAVDALRPLLERVRREIAPPPEPEAPDAETPPDFDDALRRATWLARESLREARVAIGQRRFTADQRRAWQEAARRYVAARRPGGGER